MVEEAKVKEITLSGVFSERSEGTVRCNPISDTELECEINTDKVKGRMIIKIGDKISQN